MEYLFQVHRGDTVAATGTTHETGGAPHTVRRLFVLLFLPETLSYYLLFVTAKRRDTRKKKYAGVCVVPRKLPNFVTGLFDVRDPAESGNKNGCQVIAQVLSKLD
jgi:hypothetical protein